MEREYLKMILDVAYGKIPHVNNQARILHIIDLAEEALEQPEKADEKLILLEEL